MQAASAGRARLAKLSHDCRVQPIQRAPRIRPHPYSQLAIPFQPSLSPGELRTGDASKEAMDGALARRADRPEPNFAGRPQIAQVHTRRVLAEPGGHFLVVVQPPGAAKANASRGLQGAGQSAPARRATCAIPGGTGGTQAVQGVRGGLRAKPCRYLGIAIQAPPVAMPSPPSGTMQECCNAGPGWHAVLAKRQEAGILDIGDAPGGSMLAKPRRKLRVAADPVQAALAAQDPAEEGGDVRRSWR